MRNNWADYKGYQDVERRWALSFRISPGSQMHEKHLDVIMQDCSCSILWVVPCLFSFK